MKYLLITIITSFTLLSAQAQVSESKIDLRLGLGTSLLGTGDLQTIMVENEINIKLNNYLALGEGLCFAKSDNGIAEQASFFQLNSNLFFSPFKNSRKNDFRLGTGLSWYAITDLWRSSAVYQNEQLTYSEYTIEKRNAFGFNFMIENSYTLNNNIILGLKLFTQPYLNGDINSGILLKVGLKIKK